MPFVSLCEGPIYFADQIARACGLERDELETVMVGLNHACWSVVHEYKGMDAMPLVSEAWERRKDDPELTGALRRQLRIAAEMDAIPADYFQYYYCQDEVLAELQAKPTTRAEDILGWSTGYWEHYAEQAESDDPKLDPEVLARRHPRARARDRRHGCGLQREGRDPDGQRPERRRCAARLRRDAGGRAARPLRRARTAGSSRCPRRRRLPAHVRGLVHELGEYQALAADAAWSGTRLDAIRALAAHPLMVDLDRTERVYDELAMAHREHLPERLLPV